MIEEDEVGLIHQNKTQSTGSVGKGLDPNFAIIGTAGSASHLKALSAGGGGGSRPGDAYKQVFNYASPRPKVFKVFEP